MHYVRTKLVEAVFRRLILGEICKRVGNRTSKARILHFGFETTPSRRIHWLSFSLEPNSVLVDKLTQDLMWLKSLLL